MQAFADSYAAGETPIPCVTCNQQIKFHELLATAQGARRRRAGHRPLYRAARTGLPARELYRACDADRDQSYFLFATTRAQLASLMFPLGAMPKAEVRALARELRAAGRRQGRQPGHLLRAAGPLHQHRRAPEARRRRGRRHRARRRARARPPRRASSTTPSASAAASALPGAGAAVRGAPRCRQAAGRGRAAREPARALDQPAGRQLAGRRADSRREGLEVAVRVRSSAAAAAGDPVSVKAARRQGAAARRRIRHRRRAGLRLLRRYRPARACAGWRMDRAGLEPEPSRPARAATGLDAAAVRNRVRVRQS